MNYTQITEQMRSFKLYGMADALENMKVKIGVDTCTALEKPGATATFGLTVMDVRY